MWHDTFWIGRFLVHVLQVKKRANYHAHRILTDAFQKLLV